MLSRNINILSAEHSVLSADPDSPSRDAPKARSWQHWIVGNIPGDNIDSGDVLTECEFNGNCENYSSAMTLVPSNVSDVGAVPARGTGLHRYVFLLFEQNGGRREFKESPITTE